MPRSRICLTAALTITLLCPVSAWAMNPLDNWVAGRRNDTIATYSNVGVVVMLASATIGGALLNERNHRDGYGPGNNLLRLGTAVAISEGGSWLAKSLIHRPRPMVYGAMVGDPLLAEPDNYRSFYSAHTTFCFAVGMCAARLLSQRTAGGSSAPYYLAAAGGATVGALRILSGRHFPTDVLVGAVTGTAAGLAAARISVNF